MLTTPELSDLCGRIRRLAEQYRNEDDDREASALNAAQRGLPAYTTASQKDDAAGFLLAPLANRYGLDAALAELEDVHWPNGSKTRARLLSTLIPLTPAAEAEKSAFVAADTERRAG